MSLSRTGRPLTKRYWPSALARLNVGSPANPSSRRPSRPPCTSTALARKSGPSTSASRARRPDGPGSAAPQVTGARSLPERRRLDLGFRARLDRDRPGMRLARVARRDRQARHRADRGQRLAPEAERADGQKIVVVELRGGVALDREREIGARHALAVVGDPDEAPAAAVGRDLDA